MTNVLFKVNKIKLIQIQYIKINFYLKIIYLIILILLCQNLSSIKLLQISDINNSATPQLQDHEAQNQQIDNIPPVDEKKNVQASSAQNQQTQQQKVKLYIVDEQQNSVTFKCKPTNKLQKLFQTYADNRGTNVSEIRFFYNGKRLNGDMTVQDVGLSDECTINVLRQQVGGF